MFPLLLLLVTRVLGRRGSRRALIGVVAVAAVGSFVLGAILSGSIPVGSGDTLVSGRLAFYSLPTRAWEFLAGVLLALVERGGGRLPLRAALPIGTVGLAMIAAAGVLLSESSATPGMTTLVPVIGTALVILAGFHAANPIARLLATRPVVWIGDRSYGWYLWHWPFMVFARISFPTMSSWAVLAVGVAALVPTQISYRRLEQPIRRGQPWRPRKTIGTAMACSVGAAACLIALWTLPGIGSVGAAQVERSNRPVFEQDQRCLTTTGSDDPDFELHCTWSVPDARGVIVLVGDSHAAALAGVMASVANAAGYDLRLAYRPGCAVAEVERVYDDRHQVDACRTFVDTTMNRLVLGRPDLVIFAAREVAYVQGDTFALRDRVTGETGRSSREKVAIWRRGETRTLQRLASRDIPSVVVATVPELSPFDLDLCPAWRLWLRPSSCARTRSRASVDAYRRGALTATAAAVASVPAARLVDFADDLCGPTSCSTYRDGWWMYKDANHLSAHGASTLAPRIRAEVLPAVRRAEG